MSACVVVDATVRNVEARDDHAKRATQLKGFGGEVIAFGPGSLLFGVADNDAD